MMFSAFFYQVTSLVLGLFVIFCSAVNRDDLHSTGPTLNISAPTQPFLRGIPTVPYKILNGAFFALQDAQAIVVDCRFALKMDQDGETLIPPTLLEFANTFAKDLKQTSGVELEVKFGKSPQRGSIFLSLGTPKDYLDSSGRETSEGYILTTVESHITISGASPLGTWWGTRSVLQQAVLHNGLIPVGTGIDTPGWGTRGLVLDVGRHFYPKDFLIEMCAYMSYFKQNTLHLHLSDTLFNKPTVPFNKRNTLYARFRLWSDDAAVAGLNRYPNESYTREDFDEIQFSCASRGVTILPEIDAPAHALVIVQWKPELALKDNYSMLNISHPGTMSTLRTIWSTFSDWFHTKLVHIGADEYDGPSSDYNEYVNSMNEFLRDKYNKSVRIWGSFPNIFNPEFRNISRDVSIQHWVWWEGNPYWHLNKSNFSVLNSDSDFYMVNKRGLYASSLNLTRIFHGNPNNGPWYPFIFNQDNVTDNPSRNDPYVLGAMPALWNDFGPVSSTYSEAYYSLRVGLPAIADKQWGGSLLAEQFDQIFSKLQPAVPGQNLERAIKSASDLIVEYSPQDVLADTSGNDYHATTNCKKSSEGYIKIDNSCEFSTPLISKGRNYTLSLTLKIDSLHQPDVTIIKGQDSTLMLTPNITLLTGGNYYRLNRTIPLGEWVNLTLVGRGNQTFASLASGSVDLFHEDEFLARIGFQAEEWEWVEIAIEAPLQTIGGPGSGWYGEIQGLKLIGLASSYGKTRPRQEFLVSRV